MEKEKLLTTAELSARWGGSPSVGTLNNWRSQNKGPRYIKLGGIVKYKLSDIEKYERSLRTQ